MVLRSHLETYDTPPRTSLGVKSTSGTLDEMVEPNLLNFLRQGRCPWQEAYTMRTLGG